MEDFAFVTFSNDRNVINELYKNLIYYNNEHIIILYVFTDVLQQVNKLDKIKYIKSKLIFNIVNIHKFTVYLNESNRFTESFTMAIYAKYKSEGKNHNTVYANRIISSCKGLGIIVNENLQLQKPKDLNCIIDIEFPYCILKGVDFDIPLNEINSLDISKHIVSKGIFIEHIAIGVSTGKKTFFKLFTHSMQHVKPTYYNFLSSTSFLLGFVIYYCIAIFVFDGIIAYTFTILLSINNLINLYNHS